MKAEVVGAGEGKKFVLTAYSLQTNERGIRACREWFEGNTDIVYAYQKWIDKGWVKEAVR